jgi:pyridoxal phosphate enzyme (YggS family)
MIARNLQQIRSQLLPGVKLVAVSKTRSALEIMEAYDEGQRLFGENRVGELTAKYEQLPGDIEWHLIGHLQTNKVKYIAPFVSLIHSVDSFKLLKVINKEAASCNRIINCLLQFHIAREDSKYGLVECPPDFLNTPDFQSLENIRICGVMGMATFTDDQQVVRQEFARLKNIFEELKAGFFKESPYFKEISMGMSGDYLLAMEEGSTMVRVGSNIFGERNYNG